jgi:XrtJ-associated TM-motif-TM protein
MTNRSFGFLCIALLFLVALPLHAQTGCDDSPENPTVVLALVGGAGAMFSIAGARLRARRRRRRQVEQLHAGSAGEGAGDR